MLEEKKRLIIIDSNSLIHRAYHALPPLTTKKGELVNAIYGFLLVFFKAIKEFRPDFIAAVFDFPALTFRHKKFKEYKAKRPPAPKELYQQIPKVKEVLKTFNIQIFEKEGFEGDDLIGTISKKFPKKQILPEVETIILSGDLDILQLVDKNTKTYLLRRGVKDTVLYDENSVKEKYQGLAPEQLIDFKALKGDPSDNIPGVPGIGEKTAIQLIRHFEGLENLYQKLQIPNHKSQANSETELNNSRERREKKRVKLPVIFQVPNKLKTKLLAYKEQAFLSKMLVEIKKDVLIDFNLKKCQWREYNKEKAVQILENFEFYSLIEKLPESKKAEKVEGKLKLW